jgi:hypothetical protein
MTLVGIYYKICCTSIHLTIHTSLVSIISAARFDCTIINDAMAGEELVPGVSPAVMKAVKQAHAARQEAERKARDALLRATNNTRRSSYYQPPAVNVYSQPAPASYPQGAAAASSSQQQSSQQNYRATGQLRDPRQLFPCHTCNKKGHWKDENVCRPEDIRANLARLAALVAPPQLALLAPSSQGMSNPVYYHVILLFLVNGSECLETRCFCRFS